MTRRITSPGPAHDDGARDAKNFGPRLGRGAGSSRASAGLAPNPRLQRAITRPHSIRIRLRKVLRAEGGERHAPHMRASPDCALPRRRAPPKRPRPSPRARLGLGAASAPRSHVQSFDGRRVRPAPAGWLHAKMRLLVGRPPPLARALPMLAPRDYAMTRGRERGRSAREARPTPRRVRRGRTRMHPSASGRPGPPKPKGSPRPGHRSGPALARPIFSPPVRAPAGCTANAALRGTPVAPRSHFRCSLLVARECVREGAQAPHHAPLLR